MAGCDLQAAAQATEGAILAAYQAPNYKREKAETGPAHCTVVEFDSAKIAAVTAGVGRAKAIASGVYHADWSEPPNVLYPVVFAQRASAMAQEVGLQCTVLDEATMHTLGMHILLAVSQAVKTKHR